MKTATLKYFHFESEARLVAAKLRDAGIPAHVSNTNSVHFVPTTSADIRLSVPADRVDAAREVLAEIAHDLEREPDYREADHEDIEFARAVSEGQKLHPILGYAAMFLLLLLFLWTLGANCFNGLQKRRSQLHFFAPTDVCCSDIFKQIPHAFTFSPPLLHS